MNQQTTHLLRRLCIDPQTDQFSNGRYQELKNNWKRVPWKDRRSLLKALYEAIGQEIPVSNARLKKMEKLEQRS